MLSKIAVIIANMSFKNVDIAIHLFEYVFCSSVQDCSDYENPIPQATQDWIYKKRGEKQNTCDIADTKVSA